MDTNNGGSNNTSDFIYQDVGGVEITGYTGSSTNVSIPAQINGKAIISIGDQAFGYKNLASVTIPDGVTSIGNWAFYDNSLTSVTIGANVKMGNYCFDDDNYFMSCYSANSRSAGTYTRPDASSPWSKL